MGEDAGSIETRLLGGTQRYSRDEIIARSGVSLERARSFWRALGFADVGDGAIAFTDGDLDALARIVRLIEDGVLDNELASSLLRGMGHTMARLAEWQVAAFFEHLTDDHGMPGGEARLAAVHVASEHHHDLERLLVYAWRRQLAALAARAERSPSSDSGAVVLPLTVGFADLVSYTRLAQRLRERELFRLMGRFEALASDIVAAAGGRIIKTVGDEVLYVADDAPAGAEIALQLAERMGADEVLPAVRVGVATGTIVARLGDVFGTTVNLASRLTAMAQPGTVLVGPQTAAQLEGHPAYVIEALGPREVLDLGSVNVGRLRRRHDVGASR
jgi:adenylate cyclase